MKIGIDIMGGDFAPEATIKGVIKAKEHFGKDAKLVLFGPESTIASLIKNNSGSLSDIEVVDCQQQIEMGENPAKAYSNKLNSSIVTGFTYLKQNLINGFASAGNTGAMMVGAMHVIKSIPGVIRPSIATALPRLNGKSTLILDVGINPDCRPDVLYQYGILGSIYAKEVYKMNNPRIGLLNIGSEESKGNLLTKDAYELMKDNKDFNFIGNVEGNELFDDDKADVIVCDGFVGNIILKQAEAFYVLSKARNINDEYIEKFNFEKYGGTPILGINSAVIIGHGISNATAIMNMILQTKNIVNSNLINKIKETFN